MLDQFSSLASEVKRQLGRTNPPEESLIFLEPEDLPVIATEVASVQTDEQPKQIAVWNDLCIVSCMQGQSVQVFSFGNNSLELVKRIPFADQCVEVEISGDILFVTSTNFSRIPGSKRNFMTIIDLNTMEVISSTETGGNWSKVIKKDPVRENILVSNWHSHDLSVIDVSELTNPSLRQIIKPQEGRKSLESPRGIDFTPDGKVALVTGFYSRNLIELQYDEENGQYYISYISPQLGAENSDYAGAPRDIVITSSNNALYSNLGDNTINRWSITDRCVLERVKVGKEPNSIRLLQNGLLAVSCRASNSVYIVDTESLNVIGRSETTGETPTGLAPIKNGFVATDFDSGNLRVFTF